jgi:hypothetical protein
MTLTKKLQLFAWILGAAVITLAILAWAQVRLTGRPLTSYDFFPVLGLSAFGLMWTHYIIGSARRLMGASAETFQQCLTVTRAIVLVLILLHPGIFLTSLWIDGFGLPPFSYWQVYTDFAARTALLFGSTSLFIFLAYELRRKFRSAPWWKYVEYANIMAMFAILYHGLTLGAELGLFWFRTVWFMYALTLAIAVVYNQVEKRRVKNE